METQAFVITELASHTMITINERNLLSPHLAQTIRQSVLHLLENGQNHILFDFSNVETLTSTFISELLTIFKKIKAKQGSLKLFGLTSSVKDVFEVTNLTSIFKIYLNQQDALAS